MVNEINSLLTDVKLSMMRQGCPCATTLHTQNIVLVFGQCWASVADAGPALNQHSVNMLSLLGTQTVNMQHPLYSRSSTCQYSFSH